MIYVLTFALVTTVAFAALSRIATPSEAAAAAEEQDGAPASPSGVFRRVELPDIKGCRGCGADVFRLAKTCPRCGCPDPAHVRQQASAAAGLLGLATFVVLMILCAGAGNSRSSVELAPTSEWVSERDVDQLRRSPTLRRYPGDERERIARELVEVVAVQRAIGSR